MTKNEIIRSLLDQARDKDHLANGENDSIFTGDATALREAAAMLEAQEPRVMTAQEVINHIGPIYFEVDGDEELNGWVLFRGAVPACSTKVKMVMQSRNQYCMMNDYGKNWRCWTARPNREQRKAVKWDGSTHKEP